MFVSAKTIYTLKAIKPNMESNNEAEKMGGDSTISLGGQIELSGFSDLDPAQMIVVKKVIGNYARRFTELTTKFEKLAVTLKVIHEREKSEKYELHARLLDNGTQIVAEDTDRNLYFALGNLLKKVEKELEK
jgi:ribosome-associated translation inhibitor RaiA